MCESVLTITKRARHFAAFRLRFLRPALKGGRVLRGSRKAIRRGTNRELFSPSIFLSTDTIEILNEKRKWNGVLFVQLRILEWSSCECTSPPFNFGWLTNKCKFTRGRVASICLVRLHNVYNPQLFIYWIHIPILIADFDSWRDFWLEENEIFELDF